MSYARLAKLGNLYTQFMSDEERRRRAKNPDDEFERVTTEVGRSYQGRRCRRVLTAMVLR